MTRLVLVRHGRPGGGWTDDVDPGLDDAGRSQAEAMADALAPAGPRPVVVSPMRRTRETAAPLEARWNVTARVERAVSEIPSPIDDLVERGPWLMEVMGSRWSELPEELQAWRRSVADALLAIPGDAVVVTHYIAINAAVGVATGDDRVVVFSPTYCSRTSVEIDGGALRVIELGEEGRTLVS